MQIVQKKPITAGTRHVKQLKKSLLLKSSSVFKGLVSKHQFSVGRGKHGHITSRHRGGGTKKLLRPIEFSNEKRLGVVVAVRHDSNRNSLVAVNFDFLTRKFYQTILTRKFIVGSILQSGRLKQPYEGYRTSLDLLPPGCILNSISFGKKEGAKLVRAAGTQGQVISTGSFVKIKMPSNKVIAVSLKSFACLGRVANEKSYLVRLGKAGVSRLMGRRPYVRGIAMNPVDHPHGGRTNGGRPSVTPWGLPTKNKFRLRKKAKILV